MAWSQHLSPARRAAECSPRRKPWDYDRPQESPVRGERRSVQNRPESPSVSFCRPSRGWTLSGTVNPRLTPLRLRSGQAVGYDLSSAGGLAECLVSTPSGP